MELMQAIEQRRSVRAFKGDPVGDEQVKSLVQAAVWAPSPLHQQPWSFVVIRGAEAKAKVKEICQAGKQAVIDADGPSWAGKYSFDYLDQAPVYVAVFYDPNKGGSGPLLQSKARGPGRGLGGGTEPYAGRHRAGPGQPVADLLRSQGHGPGPGCARGPHGGGHHPPGYPRRRAQGSQPRKEPKVFADFYGQ